MENPFVGKKADTLNKKAIIALFHKKKPDHLCNDYWDEALLLNDRHFDSRFNSVMFQWSTARIGDEKCMVDLETVFREENKGKCMFYYLSIAQGDKEDGLKDLKAYIDETKTLKEKARASNTKVGRSLKVAEDVYNAV